MTAAELRVSHNITSVSVIPSHTPTRLYIPTSINQGVSSLANGMVKHSVLHASSNHICSTSIYVKYSLFLEICIHNQSQHEKFFSLTTKHSSFFYHNWRQVTGEHVCMYVRSKVSQYWQGYSAGMDRNCVMVKLLN
jgi:hypothetical protein